MLASRPVRIALVAVGVWLICAVIVVWQHLRPDPEALLGITLPSSVENMQVAVNYRFIGDYRAYLRFELNEQDLPALLADPAFQGIEQSNNPMAGIATAKIGQTSLATIAQQERPTWWNPLPGKRYTLTYRSFPGPNVPYTGPDAAWYVIDKTDGGQATVYVYVLEV
jgi:hypothetical protein